MTGEILERETIDNAKNGTEYMRLNKNISTSKQEINDIMRNLQRLKNCTAKMWEACTKR